MKKRMLLISVFVLMFVSVLMLTSCSRTPRVTASNNGVAVTRNETKEAPAEKAESNNDSLIEDLKKEADYQGVFVHTDNCGKNNHYTETEYKEMGEISGATKIINILCKNFAVIFRSDRYHPYRGTGLVLIPIHNNVLGYNNRERINVDDFFTVTDYQGPDGKMYYILRPRDTNKFEKIDTGVYTFQPSVPGGAWSFFSPLFGVTQ